MKSFKHYLEEDLRKWFKQKWVRMDTKGNIKGDCAREPGEGKPKCLPQAKAHAIGKDARASAAQRKRREDPDPDRKGAPINVKTESVEEEWSKKYKSSINCSNPKGFSQKAHCAGKKKNEEVDEACWDGYTAKGTKKKGNRIVPNCVPEESDPRIPKKPGQPDKSDKHSDLYTDEDPKGTIHGLKFATTNDAKESVSKIKNSSRSHAHKIQAAVAMEQRAKEMGKDSAAAVYRRYINMMKEKTERMNEDGVAAMGGSVGPTNVVGQGAIAGTGGKGGEPGVHLPRKKKSAVLMDMIKRKPQG